MTHPGALLVLPALSACDAGGDRITLTRKFLDGACDYAARWPGRVIVGMTRAPRRSDDLDHVTISRSDLPFEFAWIDWTNDREAARELIGRAAVVLATLVDKNVHVPHIAQPQNVPVVLITEYTLQTRRQIVRAHTRNPLLRWRRERWSVNLERQYLRAIRLAAGVQCNGTPTYNAYKPHNANALLYFDTRVRAADLVAPAALRKRTADMLDGAPLRLAFSGRLIPMKGADHLPLVAAELARVDIPFTMDICGDGTLVPRIRQTIERNGLGDRVRLKGVLDFHTQLLPFMTEQVDLFVCCHRQGDPSCTYLETMSCGTPIVGYDNEAFTGLSRIANVGWLSPMDDPRVLAQRIAALHRDRHWLAEAAERSRAFAAHHTFETTMQARIDHMLACAERGTHALQEAIAC